MKKILITGTAGFIGYHLASCLIKKNFKIIGIDNHNNYYDKNLKNDRVSALKKSKNYKHYKLDIINKKKLNEIFKIYKPDEVIHLAAQAGVRYSFTNPKAYIDSNIVGFHNIIDLSKDFNVNHFIYASSSSVYGDQKKLPLSENLITDSPNSLYASSKKSNELMAYVYSNLYNLKTTGLRFFTVYGPFGRPDMALFKFTSSILSHKKIELYNKGNHMRDFTYVDDIVDGILKILKFSKLKSKSGLKKNIYNIYNLGNNNPISLKRFVKIIENNLGIKASYKYLPLQPGDVKKTFANINKARIDFDYSPKTKIEEGIKSFLKWYRSYYG